ncbi:lipopolysaccharide-induced tumor necrosis factor-alpha factor homolog [Uloborus diversus]|uniref:lipopolysaccharide-induced tumor necrosis factor-alpha factor homolog n=1 Tax=Uloborus diversus TaxID=327109 RepID=UPI002409D8C2|nr:lipopolysaccharide-induced tumor necrosis factor-alpha factor homolog [Uloborus diversus]
MSTEKINAPYAEPPPPYTSAPQPITYPTPGQYAANVAATRSMFQGPVHPPPPGGVPVFPMAPGYNNPSSQTFVVNAPTGTPAGVQAVTVLSVAQCGPYPMQVTCPHCSAHVMSETTALPGLLTWLLSCGMIFVGCWVGCCLIPCCIPECQDIEHRCPSCKQHLGTFRRINI